MHGSARRVEDTNWAQIVTLYGTLLALRPSPVVALNRAIAVAQRDGPARGLEEIVAIADRERLDAYPFYHAALGELELRRGRGETARGHFGAALTLARNPMERQFLERRMEACDAGGSTREPALRARRCRRPPRHRQRSEPNVPTSESSLDLANAS